MARTAEVIYVGNAASLIRASRQAEAATAATAASMKKSAASTVAASDASGVAAGRMASSHEKAAGRIKSSAMKIGNVLSPSGLGVQALAVAGVAAVKMSIDFQAAMERVHTQAGATQGEVDKMSKAVLGLGGKVEQGPVQLAKALFMLESVGVRGKTALEALHAAADGAAVGGADLTSTTSALASVMVAFHLKAGQAHNAMGELNAIVGVGKMHMQDLVDSMASGVLPTAHLAGVSLQSLGAAMATLTDAGVPANSAATRLNRTLLQMVAPTTIAQKGLAAIGLTQSSMADALRKPGGIINALELLKSHMQGLSRDVQLQDIGQIFGHAKGAGNVIALMDNLERVKSKYKDIGAGINKFNEDIAAWHKTSAGKIALAWSSIQANMVKVGAALAPVARIFIQGLALVVQAVVWFDQNVIKGFQVWVSYFQQAGRTLAGVWNTITRAFHDALAAIIGLLRADVALFATAATAIGKAIAAGFNAAVGWVKTAVTNVIQGGVNVVKGFFNTLYDIGKYLIQGLISGVTSAAGAVGSAIKGVVMTPVNAVKGLLGIHSPSKVFYDIGRNIAEGLVGGLLSAKEMVAAGLNQALVFPIDAAIAALTQKKTDLQAQWAAIDAAAQRGALVAAIAAARAGGGSSGGSSVGGLGGSSGGGSGGYVYPTNSPLTGRVDQGKDGSFSGPLKAIGAGVIEAVKTFQGFGTTLIERLTSGPRAGQRIYYAAETGARITGRAGQHVAAGQSIGQGLGSGGVEFGFAGPDGLPIVRYAPGQSHSVANAGGTAFANFLNSLMHGGGGAHKATRARAIRGGGNAWSVTASAESMGGTGYRGAPIQSRGYSELSTSGLSSDVSGAGHALGTLPNGTLLRVTANGKTVIVKKQDIGAGSSFKPVMGLYPGTVSDLGLGGGGQFKVTIARADGKPLHPLRGQQVAGAVFGGASSTGGTSKGGGGGTVGNVQTAIKALKDFDIQAARAAKLAKIDLQIANLNQLKAWKDALVAITDQTKQLAAQAAAVWRTTQETAITAAHTAAINAIQGGADATALAAMQAGDKVIQDQRTRQANADALKAAQLAHDNKAVIAAQQAITDYQRTQDEQALTDKITFNTAAADNAQTTAMASMDAQTFEYQVGLQQQMDLLTFNLAARKTTYAQWASDVNAILAAYGLAVAVDSATQGTIIGGPGPLGGPQVTVTPGKKTIPPDAGKPRHLAAGGMTYPGVSYTVGEVGPETFTPATAGRITPSSMGGGAGAGTVIHMSGPVTMGSTRDANRLAHKLAHRLRYG